ncbi:MAG: hypothetical protein ACYC3I_02860 [Gemmataceae bacterium]
MKQSNPRRLALHLVALELKLHHFLWQRGPVANRRRLPRANRIQRGREHGIGVNQSATHQFRLH